MSPDYASGVGLSVTTFVLGLTALVLYTLAIVAAWYDKPWLAMLLGFVAGGVTFCAVFLFTVEWATTTTP